MGFFRTLTPQYSHTRHSNLFGYPGIIEVKFQFDSVKTEEEIGWQNFGENSK